MSSSVDPTEARLRKAAELIKAGQKKEARQLLREVLIGDNRNLAAWELLVSATYNVEEEIFCLKRILALRADHPWAMQRLSEVSPTTTPEPVLPSKETPFPMTGVIAALPGRQSQPGPPGQPTPLSQQNQPTQFSQPGPPPKQTVPPLPKKPEKRKKKQRTLLPLAFAIFTIGCIGLLAAALYRAGYLSRASPASLTSTAMANHNSTCQELIDKAMQASGTFCNQVGPNRVCYGNITLQAELDPNATASFSERGDVIDISQLRRLSAAPLNLDTKEWGIAIFKMLANMPRSLPGEMVTMIVFGNTILDSGAQDLQSFTFSSEFGQIVCEKVPFDGIMINMPDGAGISLKVNGTELTLMGNASLTATRNGDMQVSLYSGSGRIVSGGQEQYFGAGQSVSVQLGGPNGTDAVSAPSTPQPLSPEELNLACTMTGQNCSPAEITPVSQETAQAVVQSGLGITPTITLTPTITTSPTITRTPTRTLTSTKTLTPTRSLTPTRTLTSTKTLTPTRTHTPNPSFSATPSPTHTNTLTRTYTPTRTFTPTRSLTPTESPSATPTPSRTHTPTRTPTSSNTVTDTPPPTNTYTPTLIPSITDTPTDTFTPTNTVPSPTPTPSNTPQPPTSTPACNVAAGDLSPNGLMLTMSITNSGTNTLTIQGIVLNWVGEGSGQQLKEIKLNGSTIWSGTDPNSPSTLPDEFNWQGGANKRLVDAGSTSTLEMTFAIDLEPNGYSITVTFHPGCSVGGSK